MNSFLAALGTALYNAFKPLQDAIASPQAFNQFLLRYGWIGSTTASDMSAVQSLLGFSGSITQIESDIAALNSQTDSDGSLALALLSDVRSLVDALRNLTAPPASQVPAPLDQEAFWSSTFAEILDGLLIDYLEQDQPQFFAVLLMSGVITISEQTPDGASRATYIQRIVDWTQLATVVTDPVKALSTNYGWGGSFDYDAFLRNLEVALLATGIPVRYNPPRISLSQYYPAAGPPADVRELVVSLFGDATPNGYVEVGAILLPIPPSSTSSQPPNGILLGSFARGTSEGVIPLSQTFSLTLDGGFESEGTLGFAFYPNEAELVLKNATSSSTVDAEITFTGKPASPWIPIGSAGSTRFEVAGLLVSVSVAGTVGDPELKIAIGSGTDPNAPPMRAVLDLSGADGFIQQIIGGGVQSIEFRTTLLWSSKTGLGFDAAAGLSIDLPLHLSLGPIDVQEVVVGLTASGSGMAAFAAVSADASLGPIGITVDKLGIQIGLTPVDAGAPAGAFGSLDVSFGLRPPDGLGLSIDAAGIGGAGYISYNAAKQEYAGALELSLEVLDLRLFGLLDTTPEVSFLLIVQAGFPPIELGFGFTLNDVGGLVGINRTMSLDALSTALRNHTLDSTLFLDDPVTQAPQLTAVVDGLFPPQQGHYVFGPMCEIGWGIPTLIEAELGFLIEFPDPVRIAIVGGITASIPAPGLAALILINLDALGEIDFDAELLSIDATLYDSRVEIYSLSGDMSFRLSWGDQPSFALAVGGFNPKFQPPPGFPSPMTRMTVSVGLGNNPYLGVTGYIAVTSNSLQFGAQVELYMSDLGFTVHGFLGFDTLFILSPTFAFEVDLYASVDVLMGSTKVLQCDLTLSFSGPTPWHAHGTASFSLCGWSTSFDVNKTWGTTPAVSAPVTDTIGPLTTALSATKSWQAILPPGGDVCATFVTPPPDPTSSVLLYPTGTLQVSQTVLPLFTQIQKFGNGAPANADYFSVSVVQNDIAGPLAQIPQDFAIGQFFNLTDDQKLTDPSFQPYPAGGTFGSTQGSWSPDPGLTSTVAYADIIIDDALAPAYQPPAAAGRPKTDPLLANLAAGQVFGVRGIGRRKYASPTMEPFITMQPPAYVVASTQTLVPNTTIVPQAGVSRNDAIAQLNAYLANFPDQRDQLQVIPAWEVPA